MSDESEKSIDLEGERFTPETVAFASGSPYLLKEVVDHDEPVNPATVEAQLFLPAGEPKRRPAMLIAHGLGGQKPVRELTYGAKLAKAGYVALVLDSFGSRGLAETKDDLKALRVTTWTLLADISRGWSISPTIRQSIHGPSRSWVFPGGA